MSAMHTTTAQLLPLAKELDENKVTPGVLGFVVFAVMGAAVWALMKSMNRHMAKVDFPEPSDGSPSDTEGAPVTSAAGASATKGAAEPSA